MEDNEEIPIKNDRIILRIEAVTHLQEKGIKILSKEYKSKFIEYVNEKMSMPLDDSELTTIHLAVVQIKAWFRKKGCKY